MKWPRWLVIGAVVLLVLGAVLYGFREGPLPVETAVVTRGPLQVTVTEEGRTRVRERYVISAPVTGVVQRIELDIGDAVQRGQVLAQLEPLRPGVLDPRERARAEAQVAAARAALSAAYEDARAAAAQADYARTELTRLNRLRTSGSVSREALDQADAAHRRAAAAQSAAEFAVEVARFQLEAAQTALQHSAAAPGEPLELVAVVAPVAGWILDVPQRAEYDAVVSAGTPLLTVGDVRELEVAVDVLSADAVRIVPGGRVLLERWGGAGELEGQVRTVEPVGFTKVSALGVEEQRVWVIVDLVSARSEWQRLGDGYRVEARFVLWEGADVLQAPTSALFRQGDGWAVFVVNAGRAQLRAVTPGRRSGLVTQIEAGLTAGEVVITHPDDALSDGAAVVPR